ncbi:MAG: hypothetical protein ACLSA6_04395 [Holdemania massiliensis]
MKEAIYLKRNMALINYTKAYYTTAEELVVKRKLFPYFLICI